MSPSANDFPGIESSALVPAFDMGWALTEQLPLSFDTLTPSHVHAEPTDNRRKP